jgi:hypothetical protein
VAATVSASVSLATFVLFDGAAARPLSVSWPIWWIGDTFGILLAAPLCWVAIGQPRALWARRRWTVALPLLLSATAFIAIYQQARRWERSQHEQTFALAAQRAGDTLQARYTEYEDLIGALGGALSEPARQGLTRKDFTGIARGYLERRHELLTLSWSSWVPDTHRARYERQLAGLVGHPVVISVRDKHGWLRPAPRQPGYYVLTYTEPSSPGPVRGIDLRGDPERGPFVLRAERSGLPTATAPVRLAPPDVLGITMYQVVGQPGGRGPGRGLLAIALQTDQQLGLQAMRADFADVTDGAPRWLRRQIPPA